MNSRLTSHLVAALAAFVLCAMNSVPSADAQQCQTTHTATFHSDAWDYDSDESDEFGMWDMLDLSGDHIIASCPHERAQEPGNNTKFGAGSLYIFERTKSGWQQQQKIFHPYFDLGSPFIEYGFAWAFGIGDGVIAAATPVADDPDVVLVFREKGGQWQISQTIGPVNGEALIGSQIEICGDVMAISGSGFRHRGSNSKGAVHIFSDDGSQWSHEQTLEDINQLPQGTFFGWLIALDGSTLVEYSYISTDEGRLHVYEKTDGLWIETFSTLAAARSLALSGDRFIIGDNGIDDRGLDLIGSASIYAKIDGVWQLEQELVPPGTYGRLGHSVDIQDDIALVSALFYDNGTDTPSGTVFIHKRIHGQWLLIDQIDPNGTHRGVFGHAVRIDGSTVSVSGRRRNEDMPELIHQQGEVAVFEFDCPTYSRADIANPSGSLIPDGIVNLFDLLLLLENWSTDERGAAIAEPSDVVDILDLIDMLDLWGPQ